MLKILKKYNDNLQYEFLPAALEISETPPSPLGRLVIWLIFTILLIALLWAYFGMVDEVAVARGKVIPDGKLKVVQPLEEGIVTAIYVTEGQRVKKGEVLIELDSTMKNVEVESIRKALETAKLEKNLLKKVIEGGNVEELVKQNDLPDEIKNNLLRLTKLKDTQYAEQEQSANLAVLQAEQQYNIEQSEKQKIEEQIKILEKNEKDQKELIKTGSVEAATLEKLSKKLEFLKKDEELLKELYEADAIAKQEWTDKLNEIELTEKDYESQKARASQEKNTLLQNWKSTNDEILLLKKELDIQIVKAEQSKNKLDEMKNEWQGVKTQLGVSVMDLVVENDKKISSLEGELEKAQRSVQYQTLISPVNGTIHGLASNTIGGVVTPAQPILTIVPDETPLVIDASVLNKDVGFIEVNQDVTVKFDTFPFQKYGAIKGIVVNISPDSVDDEKMGSIYKMKVILSKNSLNINGKETNISAGMSVSAEIKTGQRRIISFFLEPIVKYAEESLKLR